MNKLKGLRCYLSGAISYALDGGRNWRIEAEVMLKKFGVEVFNPPKSDLGILKELRNAGYYLDLQQRIEETRHHDLRMVDSSDFLIVRLDLDVYTAGTWEEIFLANRQKKPIIIMIKQGKQNCPFWLFGLGIHRTIFSSWGEVMEYLRKVDEGESVAYLHGRWVFLKEII